MRSRGARYPLKFHLGMKSNCACLFEKISPKRNKYYTHACSQEKRYSGMVKMEVENGNTTKRWKRWKGRGIEIIETKREN